MPRGSRVVVVSAHLDDAVLSCGGLLATTPGHVVTVFTGLPREGTPAPMWDRLTGAGDPVARMRDRLAEDDAALAVLGATTDRIGLLDEQYRHGPAEWSSISGALLPLLADAAEVHVPAALGGHADHLATRDAALAAAGPATTVLLYADLPYALAFGWPSWVDGRERDPLLDPSHWLTGELADSGLDPALLTPVPRALSDEAVTRKRAAVSAYASQLPALDTLAGGRLTDDHAARFELSWRLRRPVTSRA
jgi:LmbE family N-acetylglucosaminyl deacetylase